MIPSNRLAEAPTAADGYTDTTPAGFVAPAGRWAAKTARVASVIRRETSDFDGLGWLLVCVTACGLAYLHALTVIVSMGCS